MTTVVGMGHFDLLKGRGRRGAICGRGGGSGGGSGSGAGRVGEAWRAAPDGG
jgi:hypothetical protein